MLFSILKIVSKSLVGTGLGCFPLLMKLYTILYQRLAPKGIILLEVHGHKIYFDGQDIGVSPLIIRGVYEKGRVSRVLINMALDQSKGAP